MTDDSDWCNPHDYDLKLDLSETNFHGMLGAILCWYQDNDNMPFEVSDDLDESDSERRSEAELKEYQREVDAEARKVWELYQSGFIREIYFRGDQTTAVLVLESENLEDAARSLTELPLVAYDLIRFVLIPLVPYPGLERLFQTEEPELSPD